MAAVASRSMVGTTLHSPTYAHGISTSTAENASSLSPDSNRSSAAILSYKERTFFYDSPGSPEAVPTSPIRSLHQSVADSSIDPDLPPPPQSPYPDQIDPSPVESNGTASTDTTRIDDDDLDSESLEFSHIQHAKTGILFSPVSLSSAQSPLSPDSLAKLDTSVDPQPQEEPESGTKTVIAAPSDFRKSFSRESSSEHTTTRSEIGTHSPTSKSEKTVVSPTSPEAQSKSPTERNTNTTPLRTDIAAAKLPDRSTPRAQTRQEIEADWNRRHLHSNSLEGIPEGNDMSEYDATSPRDSYLSDTTQDAEIAELQGTLSECWTLCNRLGNLSSPSRKRMLTSSSKPEPSETAWRSCWKLIQHLYATREEDPDKHITPTLDLCRAFFRAVFDARPRSDEASDAVLRVSVELNDHLYGMQDAAFPPHWQERTLDFYVTLCHRFVKFYLHTLPDQTRELLCTGWALAEILFELRQINRKDRDNEADLLSRAIDSCWELCDRFRDGWTRNRTERSTPRPSQHGFSARSSPSISHQSSHASITSRLMRPDSTLMPPPETPTTIFDDVGDPMDSVDNGNQPNILVLGKQARDGSLQHRRWPSSASNASSYTSSSYTTGTSTAGPSSAIANQTAITEKYLDSIRVLLVQAAQEAGYVLNDRSSSPNVSSSPRAHSREQTANLMTFVRTMPADAFGHAPWQRLIVAEYRKLVQAWPLPTQTRSSGQPLKISEALIPITGPRRVSGDDIAQAVNWMMRASQWRWLGDLFRVTFGCHVDDKLGNAEIIAVA